MPTTLPSDIVTALTGFILDFWLPACYFRAPTEPGDPSTIAFFEAWQAKLLAAGVLHHEASGTLLGGYFSIVWVILALIKLVLNFSALRGDISHPVALPKEYDVSRVPLGEWKRLLGWCHNWITKLESDIEVLSKTSGDRQQSSGSQPPVAAGSEAALPSGTSAPNQPSTTLRKTGAKKAPTRKSRVSKNSDDEGSDGNGDSDHDDESGSEDDEPLVDYEKLDTHADSDTEPSDDEPGDDEPSDDEPSETARGNTGDDTPAYSPPPGMCLPNVYVKIFPISYAMLVPRSSRPIPRPVPPSSSGPTPSVPHVFGPFRPLPVVKKRPPLPKDYGAIIAGLTKCDSEIASTLRAWYEFGAEADKLDVEEAEAAAAKATSLPTEWRSLFQFVHTASLAWKRAVVAAPSAFQTAYEFMMLVRESFPFVGAADRFRDITHMMDSDAWDLIHLQELELRVNRGMAELRWIHKELIQFENLSSQWATKLPNVWPPTDIPDDVAALRTLALPLLECQEKSKI